MSLIITFLQNVIKNCTDKNQKFLLTQKDTSFIDGKRQIKEIYP